MFPFRPAYQHVSRMSSNTTKSHQRGSHCRAVFFHSFRVRARASLFMESRASGKSARLLLDQILAIVPSLHVRFRCLYTDGDRKVSARAPIWIVGPAYIRCGGGSFLSDAPGVDPVRPGMERSELVAFRRSIHVPDVSINCAPSDKSQSQENGLDFVCRMACSRGPCVWHYRAFNPARTVGRVPTKQSPFVDANVHRRNMCDATSSDVDKDP